MRACAWKIPTDDGCERSIFFRVDTAVLNKLVSWPRKIERLVTVASSVIDGWTRVKEDEEEGRDSNKKKK